MKRNLIAVFSSVILILLLTVIAENAFTSSGGPPPGKTGSPGDGGATCASGCHTGMAVTAVVGWITSNVPVTGYVPGQTYTITATASQSGCVRFGFQISPQSSTGTYLGTLVVTDLVNTQIVSTKYIEQKTAGTTGFTGSHPWTFNWTAPAAGTGTVTFYGAFNCSNNNNSSSGDNIYTSTLVIPQCSAITTVTANGPTTFCSGGSVTLDAGSGFLSYLWSNNATTQTINVTSGGVYSVTVTNSGGCLAFANSAVIVVNPLPPAPIITPGGATSFCQGGSVSLIGTAGLTSYLWSTGATTQSIIANSSANYSLTVTNSNGCSASSTSTQVVVNSLPTPAIAGASTICAGGTSVLDAGTGFNIYSWSTGASTQTIAVALAGTYSVTVTNSNGCTGVASILESIGTVLTPIISLSGASAICEGTSIILDAGSGFNTYSWSNGSNSQTIVVESAGSFAVNVSDVNGCTGISNIVSTTVADTPISTASVFPAVICSGENILAIATGDSLWSYEWNPGALNGSSLTLTPIVTTTYLMTATNSSNCETTVSVTAVVLSLPPIPIITQSGGLLQCNSPFAITYQWLLNGSIISGATNSVYNAASQVGDYSVLITDSSGCQNESIPFNYLGDGIYSVSISNIEIFPNPFTNNIEVQNIFEKNEIKIFDLHGRMMFQKINAEENEVINTSELSTGFYLIRIIAGTEIINKVIVKN